MTTYRDVKAQIAKLEKQAADLFKKEVTDVIAGIRSTIAEYGLTAADLGFGSASKKAKSPAGKRTKKVPLTPKYRDPVSGKTWNGHGKAPGWLAEATEKGRRDDFLISKVIATTTAKKVSPAKKVTQKKVIAAKPAAAKKKAAAAAKPAAKPATKKRVTRKKAATPKPAPTAAT